MKYGGSRELEDCAPHGKSATVRTKSILLSQLLMHHGWTMVHHSFTHRS